MWHPAASRENRGWRIPRQADPLAITRDNKRDFELFRFVNKTTYRYGDNTFKVFGAWTYKDLDHPLNFGIIDQLTNDLIIGTDFENTTELFGRDNRFRTGLSYSWGETDNAIFATINGKRGAPFVSTERTATNLEFFVENQHGTSSQLTLTTALALTYATREERPTTGGPATLDEDYFNLAPNIGFTYQLGDSQFFGGYSSSFEPPSFSESLVGAQATNAQTADSLEFGNRGTHSNLRWDATAYYSKVKDELLSISAPGGGDPVATRNADNTVHYGIELGTEIDLLGSSWLEQNPAHRLVIRSAYTYGSFKFDGDPIYGDNRLAGLPPHLIRGELLWENEQGYYAGPTFEWSPVKSFIDHSNTFDADPYALLGFKVGRRLTEGVSWFIEAKNLTRPKNRA